MEQACGPYWYKFDNWAKFGQNPPLHFSLSAKSSNLQRIQEVQKTAFEKLADSFEPACITPLDSFKILRNPGQTVFNFLTFYSLLPPDCAKEKICRKQVFLVLKL